MIKRWVEQGNRAAVVTMLAMALGCGDDSAPDPGGTGAGATSSTTTTGGGSGGDASVGGAGGGGGGDHACFALCEDGPLCATVEDPSSCDAVMEEVCSDVMDIDVREGCRCPGEPGGCTDPPSWF